MKKQVIPYLEESFQNIKDMIDDIRSKIHSSTNIFLLAHVTVLGLIADGTAKSSTMEKRQSTRALQQSSCFSCLRPLTLPRE
jgi:hypothetical protein